jgi:hypothetical protein
LKDGNKPQLLSWYALNVINIWFTDALDDDGDFILEQRRTHMVNQKRQIQESNQCPQLLGSPLYHLPIIHK